MNTRSRLTTLLVIAGVIFTVGIYLRLEAHTLCTQDIHVQGTPGTAPNVSYTDEPRSEALVEIARVLLCLASVLMAIASTAWVFLPDFRLPDYTDMMKNWPSGPEPSSHDPDFPR